MAVHLSAGMQSGQRSAAQIADDDSMMLALPRGEPKKADQCPQPLEDSADIIAAMASRPIR